MAEALNIDVSTISPEKMKECVDKCFPIMLERTVGKDAIAKAQEKFNTCVKKCVSQKGGKRNKRRKSSIKTQRKRRRHRNRVSRKGSSKSAPNTHQRTVMLKKCGRKCFLGPKKSFPICTKGTCRVNKKGVKAAYIRAKQWGKSKRSYTKKHRPRHHRSVYTRVARKAKRILRKNTKLYNKR